MRVIDKAVDKTGINEEKLKDDHCIITIFGPDAVDKNFSINNCAAGNCEDCWQQKWYE